MAFDITVEHPSYQQFVHAWTMMRDAFDGEDCVKAKGEQYLPMKSGTAAVNNPILKAAIYKAYKDRAEFPELVAPTIRGSLGIMLRKPADIKLPPAMELLREKVTLDGLSIDELHRRIACELLLTGRIGLLPGINQATGVPYVACYTAESIVNWDDDQGKLNFVVFDETAPVRDRDTGKWVDEPQYREIGLDDRGYYSRQWTQNAKLEWIPGEVIYATTRNGGFLDFVPFIAAGTNDLTITPDDVPLFGLGRIAFRIYRLDADYVHSLQMTSEPTPVVIGFTDPISARKDKLIPTTIGSAAIWVLPPSGDAKFLEFSGQGIDAQKTAISDALNRAVAFGAQILTDTKKTAESGDALQLRLNSQHSLLQIIAMNSAAALERVLRYIATWIGENPDEVIVTPNLEFFDEPMTAQEMTALVASWQAGAISYSTMFDRMKRGQIVPGDRTEEEEQEKIASDPFVPDPALGGATEKIPNRPSLIV